MRSLSTKAVRRFATTLGALALLTGIARSAAVAQAQAGTATTRTATSPDGIRIAYETHGDGPLVGQFHDRCFAEGATNLRGQADGMYFLCLPILQQKA